jgi:hypothetical protein
MLLLKNAGSFEQSFEHGFAVFRIRIRILPSTSKKLRKTLISTSIADPDPGSGAFLTPGSVIRNRFFPDPGYQTQIFENLLTIF